MTGRLLQDMARGSLSTVRQGIQRAKSDLSAKEYRNIDAKYRAQLLELKTAEMAASDLNEYHKVQCPHFGASLTGHAISHPLQIKMCFVIICSMRG